MWHHKIPAIDVSDHLAVSPCPYARHDLANTLGLTLTTPDKLPYAARILRRYSQQPGLHSSSVFIVNLDIAGFPESIPSLAAIFRYLVHSANSTQFARNRLYSGILEPQWRLTIENAAFFAIVLSPLYPATHHRYTRPTSLFLFQPESLFTALGVTTGPSRFRLSRAVEKRFSTAGRPYASAHKKNTPKSQRIVLTDEGEPIAWWRLSLPEMPLC